METKKLTITPPEGFEIDQENSTFKEIVFKKIGKQVKVWKDIEKLNGVYIDNYSNLYDIKTEINCNTIHIKNIFIDEKHAKSALAMAQISQLMPYYGGAITYDEWHNSILNKYCWVRNNNSAYRATCQTWYQFIAFHTAKQRDEFYDNNKQLVHDYLMIEE